MRLVSSIVACACLLLLAPACAAQNEDRLALADSVSLEELGADKALILHYHRADGVYDNWNVWAWPEGGQGAGFPFDGRDAFGAYAVIPLDGPAERAGFIVRLGEWEGRDLDFDRFADFDNSGIAEIWINSGDPAVYGLNDEVDTTVRVTGAFLDSDDTITVSLTGPIEDPAGVTVSTPTKDYAVAGVGRSERTAAGRVVYDVTLTETVADADVAQLMLDVPGEEPEIVYARDVLTAPRFSPLDAQLGPRYTQAETTFQTWSPVASRVELLLGNGRSFELEPGEKGLWSVTVPGDLDGVTYRYAFTSYGKLRVVPDVHAFAALADGSQSVVVDLDKTDPAGFSDLESPPLAKKTDEIIYEVHVRDYTIADASVEEDLRGTYLGLIHRNPSIGGSTSTGLDHMLDLGVTAVHLLPIHDYPGERDEYNWGYWTSFFNVPEANYATPDATPAGVITELKTTIAGLNNAGVRVILDVVYNHTSSSYEYSPFFQAVPYYYFRTYADGRLMNDAGVGNTMADERPMVRKYILDSLEYWITEYKIDGLRFDLMGCHRPETMAAVAERVLSLRPGLTVYGEPWTGGGTIWYPKGAQRGSGIAVFNDHIRNAIRGDLDGTATGFAVGDGGDAEAIKRGIAGAIDDFADDPVESINYASAHDNRTLWDKIEFTLPDAAEPNKRSMVRLALGIVMTSQGVPFLHGGSDFARTKFGNHNSYNAGDEINKFDWARKAEFATEFEYVRGLAQLRRAHPAFRMATAEDVRTALRFLPTDGTVAFTLDGSVAGDEWGTILVAYNGSGQARSLDLPSGEWTQVVDDQTAGVEPIRTLSGPVELPAWSMIVCHQ